MSKVPVAPTPRFSQSIPRIDVHHHYFPSDLKKEQSNVSVGWKTPPENLPWSPNISLQAMDAMKVDFSVLSFPAISSGCISEESRATARRRNELAAGFCRDHPDRFGFFATLPFLEDVEGCLQEVKHSLDVLNAIGVSLSSSYGEGSTATYIGHEKYNPIWAELNSRHAIVFLHGSQVPSSTPYPDPCLGIPITEVPNETFKAAAHLVVTGNRRRFPDVKIILSHLGGSTPFLAPRVAVLSNHMGCTLSPDEILDDFKTFYYETALSASDVTLKAIDNFVQKDHILFGTDFPAVSTEMVEWFTSKVEAHYADQDGLRGVMGGNAIKLFWGS